ncbi:MAG: BrnA antitoxin family protein [Rhodoferax sp.]|nr:BrnA antitoxin family protein [Rhodoferax sp.]
MRARAWCSYSHHLCTQGDQAHSAFYRGGHTAKAEYDLSKLKSRKNPYASKLKKPVTMRLSEDVVDYFKGMADESGVPYQSLINLYLRDCLANSRKVQINWPQTV